MLSVFWVCFSRFSVHQSVKSRTSKFPGREIESLTTLHYEYKRVTWSRIENAPPLMYCNVCNSFHVYYYCLSWQTVEGFPPEIKRRISLYTIKITPSDRYIAGRCRNLYFSFNCSCSVTGGVLMFPVLIVTGCRLKSLFAS